jgi:hypothetical protein
METGIYSIQLRSIAGQLQVSRSVNVTHKGQVEIMDMQNRLAPGSYFVMVYDSNGKLKANSKVIVQ